MKGSILLGILLCAVATPALTAPNSCETVKASIQEKIIANGVPESEFSLAIIPNDEVVQSGTNSVVGHCANDTYKIVYTRFRDTH